MRTYRIAKPRSTKDIQKAAHAFRMLAECGDLDSFKIIDFIEFTVPRWQENFSFQILPDEKMLFKEGETCPSQYKMSIPEGVYNKALEGNPRSLFTLAHELGHLFLHGEENVTFYRSDYEITVPPYQNAEWQANLFAAELLAPSSSILKYGLTVQQMQDCFNVSKECAQKCYNRVHRSK